MKKIIPVVALASALGVAGLASCKPEIKEVIKEVVKEVEVKVPEHHHHYGISVDAKEGVTVEVPEVAEVGTEVTVKATVAAGSEFTVTGVEAGEGVEVKAGETGTWTFKMPERTVTLKVNTSDILYNVEISDADAEKGTMAVVDAEGNPVTSAPAGTEVIAKFTQIDKAKRESAVKVGETELVFDAAKGGYPFTIPSGGAKVTYILVDALYRISFNDARVGQMGGEGVEHMVFVNSDLTVIPDDSEGDYKEEAPVNGVYSIAPGRTAYIEIGKTDICDTKIASIKINGEPAEYMDTGSGLFIEIPIVDKDIAIEVELVTLPKVGVAYIVDEHVEVFTEGEYDPETDSSPRLPAPTEVAEGSDLRVKGEIKTPGRKVDQTKSGIYDSTGKVGEIGDWGDLLDISHYGLEAGNPVQVRIFTEEAFALNGLKGGWVARRTYGYGDLKLTSLQVAGDGSFTFAYNDTSNTSRKTISGELEGKLGSYTWEETLPEGAPESRTASKLSIWPATAEDGSIRWLNTRYYDSSNKQTYEMYLTAGVPGEVYNNRTYELDVNEDECLRYFELSEDDGAWVKSTDRKMEVVNIGTEGADGAFTPVTGRKVKTGSTAEPYAFENEGGFGRTKYVKFTSNYEMKYSGIEMNTYDIKDAEGAPVPGAEAVALDGFGGYTAGTETGSYKYDAWLKTLKLTPKTGDARLFDIKTNGFRNGTLTVREMGVKDAVSGLTFEIPYNNGSYTKTLRFIDRDTVTVQWYEASYKYNEAKKEISLHLVDGAKVEDLTFTLNDDFSITCVKGSYWQCDLTGKTFRSTTLNTTLTPAEGQTATENIVLTGGETPTYTMGETSGSYTISYEETGVILTLGTKRYTVDLATKTYTRILEDVSWVSGANVKYAVGTHDYGSSYGESAAGNRNSLADGTELFTDVTIDFSTDGTKISKLYIKNNRIEFQPDDYGWGGYSSLTKVGENSWTDLEFVVDAEALTLTVKLNDTEVAAEGEVIVFNIDAQAKTLVTTETIVTRTGNLKTVKLGAGLVVAKLA